MKPYQRVFKILTERLKSFGFEPHGTSWWQIRRGRVWHRVHIHKFSYTDSFRVHPAIHAVGLEDKAPWLNGRSSPDGWAEEKKFGVVVRRYTFDFEDTPESLSRCADELRDYIARCVLPWFEKWREPQLIGDADSPLTSEAREYLRKKPNKAPEPTPTPVTPPAKSR